MPVSKSRETQASRRPLGNPTWTDRRFGRRFRLLKIRDLVLTVDPTVVFLLPLLFLTLGARLFPYYDSSHGPGTHWLMALLTTVGFFLSVLAHGLAHLRVAQRLGHRPHGLFLSLFGSAVPAEAPRGSTWDKVRLNLAGPAFSLALAGLLFFLTFLSDANARPPVLTAVLFHVGAANLTLGLLHLLPALPLDGGRLILAVLSGSGARRAARTALYYSGNGIGAMLVLGGLWQVSRQCPVLGGWAVVAGLLVLRANLAERDLLALKERLAGIPIRALTNTLPITVSPFITLARFAMDCVRRYPFRCYPVVADGALTGIIRPGDLYRFPNPQWFRKKVQEVQIPPSRENTVAPETEAAEALSLMLDTGNPRLLVSERGRLIGIVSYGDLLESAEPPAP